MNIFDKTKRIPTILGVLVLLFGVAAGVFLVQSKQLFRLGASPEKNPKNIRITNVADTSLAVSWTTDEKVEGYLKWGENEQLLDKSNPSGDQGGAYIHNVTLFGLVPKTDYYFKIISGGTEYDNEGIAWKVTTGPTLTDAPSSKLISGTIQTPSGTPASGVLVYASVGGSNQISTVTLENGSWVLPISSARTQSLDKYVDIDPEKTLVELFVQGGSLGISSAQIYPQSATPVPDIILGQVYDFKNLPASEDSVVPNSEIDLPDSSTKSSGFTSGDNSASTNPDEVTLQSVDEGEEISTDKPEFFGEGPAGTSITITVESDPQTQIVEIDQYGEWDWTPPDNLEEGIHQITITWEDAKGVLQSITRTFVVNAQEEPAYTATPSATPTSTPRPTSTPTSTPTPSPGVTITATVTATPTLRSTSTPTPTKVSSGSALPDAGVSMPTILMGTLGVILVIVSFALII